MRGYSYAAIAAEARAYIRAGTSVSEASRIAIVNGRKRFRACFPNRPLPSWLCTSDTRRKRAGAKRGPLARRNPARKVLAGRQQGGAQQINAAIAQARKLGQEFSGHDPRRVNKIMVRPVPNVALAIGPVIGIIYRAKRDNEQTNYQHKFKRSSRPTLAVSSDGKQIVLVGGDYTFTELGIEDAAL